MLDKIFEYLHFQFSVEAPIVLLILIFLEALLSADNAIALAAIVQGLNNKKLEEKALNFGLVVAYLLRITLLLTATWVEKFWQFQLIGAVYLLWLAWQHFNSGNGKNHVDKHHSLQFSSLLPVIPVIALTDLAFSLDSVTTAIAVSQERWLVIAGTTIGVVTLRLMAGLFIRWLDEFENLENAGYVTVALVGLRLLLKVVNNTFALPQWIMVTVITLILAWGFSKRTVPQVGELVVSKSEPETSAGISE